MRSICGLVSRFARSSLQLENLQNSVDTSELLEYHDPAANAQTLEHVGGEKCFPRREHATAVLHLSLGLFVEHDCSLDFQKLGNEKWVCPIKSSESGEGTDAVVLAMFHHQPSGRERQEEHAEEEDPGWNKLQRQGNTP